MSALERVVTMLLQSRHKRYAFGKPEVGTRRAMAIRHDRSANVTDHALPQPTSVPLPIRYFDVVLVLAFVPFALLASLPAFGTLAGAGVWLFQRAIGVTLDVRAAAQDDYKVAMRITFVSGMARPFILGLSILAIGQIGEREDGLTAALLCLVAFTVYMILSFVFRPTSPTRNPSA